MDRWKFVNEKWIPRPVSRREGFVSGIALPPSNLRPFGAPPSIGRRENAASQTPHEDGLRYENTTSPHSSFRAKARNLFRSRQGKGCERSGKRETPCSLRPPKTVFHADRSTQEKEHGKRKRSLGCARDDDTRIPLSRTTFIPLRCQPPPLRGTSFQRKEGECRFTDSS